MCMRVCILVQLLMKDRGGYQASCSVTFGLIPLRQPFTEPGVRLVDRRPGRPPFSTPHGAGVTGDAQQ